MKITFDNKAGDELSNLLYEIDGLIEMGDIVGLSPQAAKMCRLFYKGTNTETDVIFTDEGLNLK